MPHYLLSTYSTETDARPTMTEDDERRSWEQIVALEADMKSAGVWVFSARLHSADTATVVRRSRDEVVMTDGPFVEAKEHLGGFYIIKADDLDGALRWASRVTDAIASPIEVWPFVDVAGS